MSGRKMLTTPMVHNLPNGEQLVEMNFDKEMTIGEFKMLMENMNAKTGFMMRMCDACERESDAGNVNCECTHCQTAFDLCSQCAPHYSRNICPVGYGCKKRGLGYLPLLPEDLDEEKFRQFITTVDPVKLVLMSPEEKDALAQTFRLEHAEGPSTLPRNAVDSSVVEVDTTLEKDLEDAELYHEFARSISLHGFDEREREKLFQTWKRVREEMGFGHDHQSLNHH